MDQDIFESGSRRVSSSSTSTNSSGNNNSSNNNNMNAGNVANRERSRSESGKENSGGFSRRLTRQRRSERGGLRERATTTAGGYASITTDATLTDVDHEQHTASIDDTPIDLCVSDPALASDCDYLWGGDQHSSEEELECINGPVVLISSSGADSALRFGPSAFAPPTSDNGKVTTNRTQVVN